MGQNHDEKIAEKYVKQFGWEKVKGKKLDHEAFNPDFEYSYWEQDALDDFLTDCEFWRHKEHEQVYEDIWELVESIETEEDEYDKFEAEELKKNGI